MHTQNYPTSVNASRIFRCSSNSNCDQGVDKNDASVDSDELVSENPSSTSFHASQVLSEKSPQPLLIESYFSDQKKKQEKWKNKSTKHFTILKQNQYGPNVKRTKTSEQSARL